MTFWSKLMLLMEKRVNIFWYIVCLHLPSYRRCPSSFLKGLLNGTKSVSKEYLYPGQAFKLYEIEKQHIPPFTELGVKKLWNHFKRNKTVCNYMPEYPENRFQNESSSLECFVLSIQKRLEEWLKLPIKQGIKNMKKAKMIW